MKLDWCIPRRSIFLGDKSNPECSLTGRGPPVAQAGTRQGSETERQSDAPAPGWPRALSKAQRAAQTGVWASDATPRSALGYPGP